MEFSDNKPIYLQLADQIMDDVESNWMHNGDRILSVREYAAKTGVNANTVMRAYTWLQQENIIYNQRGIGFFYTGNAREMVIEKRKKHFFEKEMDYFMSRLKVFSVSPDELSELYRSYLNH